MADEHDLGQVMTHILLGVERAAELLRQTTDLHREVVRLLAEISDAATQLEVILERTKSGGG
jgi:hypothetical protein